MSTKKFSSRTDVLGDESHVRHSSSYEEQLVKTLDVMQQKINASPALNGGFDRLVEKVDSIEQKVGSIHEAIYHPDDGLYARIKLVEDVKKHVITVEKLEKEVLTLQQHKDTREELREKEERVCDESVKLVLEHSTQIKDLLEFKKRVNEIAKWVIVTFAGCLVTGSGKLLYDYLSSHLVIR